MDDTSQIEPPSSFTDLFRDHAGRLATSAIQIVARYEFCEDLACHLIEQAQALYHQGHGSEEGILLGIYTGLGSKGSVCSLLEAGWIVRRLAELLQWPIPTLLEF